MQEMDESERMEYLRRKEHEEEDRRTKEDERKRGEEEAALMAAEESRLQAELLARYVCVSLDEIRVSTVVVYFTHFHSLCLLVVLADR